VNCRRLCPSLTYPNAGFGSALKAVAGSMVYEDLRNQGLLGDTLYGSATVLNTDPKNPTLENNASDAAFETDFRSVHARVADHWLGKDSTQLLGGNFRKPDLTFI
jgi:hypothetical protein